MELIRGLHNLRDRHRGCALAIGNFDGLHRGHQELLAHAREHGRKLGVPSTAMFFEPTPREFFTPDRAPPRISEFRDKMRRFERVGMDRLICLRFDAGLAAMSAESFVDDLILDRLGARAVVVGVDFRYGANRMGDSAQLRQHVTARGAVADIVDAVMAGNERCSSTAIREAMATADLDRIERQLGRRHSMIGRVRHGLKLGRKLGMRTANIHLRHVPALRLGIYAVVGWATGERRRWSGVASLGVRPTVGGTRPLLETHFFDNSDDWYGREIEIEFVRYLRPEMHFDSLEALAEQMQRDAAQARMLLA